MREKNLIKREVKSMKTIKFEDFDVNGERIDDLEMDVDNAFEQINKLQDRCDNLERYNRELVDQIKYLDNKINILCKIIQVKIINKCDL